MKHRSSAGFSIIDIIMGLSIVAVAVVGIMLAQRNYIQSTSQVEVGLRAVSLANSVMSTIRMHRYDENSAEPWSATLGTDVGESSASLYDDIDDYNGVSWDFSSDGFSGFTISSSVFNVNLSSSWLTSVGVRTNFKRIVVSVDHGVLDSPVVVSSIYAGIDQE
jgi:Tfp pilus assembly protein PilV